MRVKKSHAALLALMLIMPVLVILRYLSYRARVVEPPLAYCPDSAAPAALDTAQLPRLSPTVPWHAITFYRHETAGSGDTLISVFTDLSLQRQFSEIYYPEMYPTDRRHEGIMATLLLLHSNKSISVDPFIGSSGFYITGSLSPGSGRLSVRVRLLKHRLSFDQYLPQNIFQHNNFTVTDSLYYQDGCYLEYCTKRGPEMLNCLWTDGPWITRITIRGTASEQRRQGFALLRDIRNDVFDYYRYLNRRFQEE